VNDARVDVPQNALAEWLSAWTVEGASMARRLHVDAPQRMLVIAEKLVDRDSGAPAAAPTVWK
jgi:hypothetical protein